MPSGQTYALVQIWQADKRLFFVAVKPLTCDQLAALYAKGQEDTRPPGATWFSYDESDIEKVTHVRTSCK